MNGPHRATYITNLLFWCTTTTIQWAWCWPGNCEWNLYLACNDRYIVVDVGRPLLGLGPRWSIYDIAWHCIWSGRLRVTSRDVAKCNSKCSQCYRSLDTATTITLNSKLYVADMVTTQFVFLYNEKPTENHPLNKEQFLSKGMKNCP